MKTHPSLRTSSFLLLALLGVSSCFALQAQTSTAPSGVSGSGSASGTVGTGGTSGSASGSASGGTTQSGTSTLPGTPDQPGLPTQPGVPDQPGLPRQPGVPDQPGLPTQPGIPDQPGLPVQPGRPDPNLPVDPTDPTVGTTTTTTATTGVNADGTRVVGGTVVDGSVLDTRAATQRIESTTFATRDRALRQIETSSTQGAGYIGMIERNTGTLTGEARTRVNDAIRRANAARTELDKSISLARSATERRWSDARAELLERYRAYDQALAEAREAAIEAGAQVDTQAGTSANAGM